MCSLQLSTLYIEPPAEGYHRLPVVREAEGADGQVISDVFRLLYKGTKPDEDLKNATASVVYILFCRRKATRMKTRTRISQTS